VPRVRLALARREPPPQRGYLNPRNIPIRAAAELNDGVVDRRFDKRTALK